MEQFSTSLSDEWFLAQLDRPDVQAGPLITALEAYRAKGPAEPAEEMALLVQQMLVEKGKRDDAMHILALRIRWTKNQPPETSWADEILNVLGASIENKTLVEHVGFNRRVPANECFRRVQLLRSLHPGVLCYDKTWGLGLVLKLDYFYKRVDIDFEKKKGHHLALAYAAETLDIVHDEHILAWRHRRNAELKELVQNDAAEAVRLALRSFGPLSVAKLQQTLVPNVVADADWKRFWDQARKGLKKEGLVAIPTSRNEPIRLLDKIVSVDDDWFAKFALERDLQGVVEHFEEWSEKIDLSTLTEDQRGILLDRYRFVIKGAGHKHLGLVARLLMVVQVLKILSDAELAQQIKLFFDKKTFAGTLAQLPSREAKNFLALLAKIDRDGLVKLLLDLMPTLEVTALNEAFTYLFENGEEERCVQLYKSALDKRFATIELLSWLSRNVDRIRKWSIGLHSVWTGMMIDGLEEKFMGDRLKAQNQLRERFAKQDWLRSVMSEMDELQRKKLLLRVKDSSAWSTLDKQSVMAHMIKLYPELGELLVAKKQTDIPTPRGPVTSWRTYRERQMQLHKIVSIELPKVAKDIGIARSYGDLRENFEFKAAKEAQTVLARKRDELDQMLRMVRPTDFEGLPSDRAGLATCVVLQYEDGKTERYYILGEWDGDQAIGIISCTARMAQALDGAKKGDVVTVPTEQGETRCTIADVSPLPDDIRAWINAS